jgi:hypothetical protein
LISRWDSVAIVPNTSDDLPDPETPVNTVILRFGMSTETFFRLLTRALRISMFPYIAAPFRSSVAG